MDTPGGRYYAEIEDEAPVTREGQLIFFAQFLHTTGKRSPVAPRCWAEWPAHAPRRPAHRKVSLQHENSAQLMQAIVIVSNTLRGFYAIAERWSIEQRWTLLLTHIFRHWLGGKWLGTLPAEANLLLSG